LPEIEFAVLHIVEAGFGVARATVATEVARIFGAKRVGPDVVVRLQEVIDGLLRRGALRESGNTLTVA
jgi:hypothetical protein